MIVIRLVPRSPAVAHQSQVSSPGLPDRFRKFPQDRRGLYTVLTALGLCRKACSNFLRSFNASWRLSGYITAFSFRARQQQRLVRLPRILRLTSPSGFYEGSDREVNAPEKTHLEVIRHVAAVRPAPRRWIDVRAVI